MILLKLISPMGENITRFFPESLWWKPIDGDAEFTLTLKKFRDGIGYELTFSERRNPPIGTMPLLSGCILHRRAFRDLRKLDDESISYALRRFAATRPIRAVVLRDHGDHGIRVNRGADEGMETGMRFFVATGPNAHGEMEVRSVMKGDSLLFLVRSRGAGRGIRPEATAVGLWVP